MYNLFIEFCRGAPYLLLVVDLSQHKVERMQMIQEGLFSKIVMCLEMQQLIWEGLGDAMLESYFIIPALITL
jgi:hypothetical protein